MWSTAANLDTDSLLKQGRKELISAYAVVSFTVKVTKYEACILKKKIFFYLTIYISAEKRKEEKEEEEEQQQAKKKK